MSTITLVNPGSPFLLDEKVFPPLGLMRIYSVLKKEGHEVNVVDLNFGTIYNFHYLWREANFIMFTATSPQYPIAVAAMREMRQYAHKDAVFIIGGPHATLMPELCRKDGFDVVIVGDGEHTIVKAVIEYSKGKEYIWDSIPVDDIDSLPFPDRDCVRIHDYKYTIDGINATSVVTSRGCPYECAFCCKMDRKLRLHSAEYVLAEVKMLKEKYGFNAIMFFDDLFILDRERLENICRGLKEMGIAFRCFVRANLVNRDIFGLLARSGCREVGFGAESGSQKILDIIKKRTTTQQNTETVRMAHEAGLKVKAFLIVGLPGETWQTVKETEDWIREAKPDDYDVTIFTPYPGSDIWQNKKEYDIEFDKNVNWSAMWYKGVPGHYNCTVRTKALGSDDIIRAREMLDKIKEELYGRKS